MITDQYYENNCYHVTMASEGNDLIGASRSESHTGDANRDFPFVYI